MKRNTEQLNWDISKIVYDHIIKDNTIVSTNKEEKLGLWGKALIVAFPQSWGTDMTSTFFFMQFLIESAFNLEHSDNNQTLKRGLKILST